MASEADAQSPMRRAVSSVFRRLSSQSLLSLVSVPEAEPLVGSASIGAPVAPFGSSNSIQDALLVSASSPEVLRSTERRQPSVIISPSRRNSQGFSAEPDEQGPPLLRLSRSNSMLSEHERRVFSSLVDKTSQREKAMFFFFTIVAIVFRVMAVLMVTSETAMEFDMHLVTGQSVRLAKQLIQDSYLPQVMGDLYAAGAVGSLFITLSGSILVPLLRVSLVFFCYCVPVEERYHELRTFILFVLDHVGRFILVDIFAMGYVAVFVHKRLSLLDMLGLPHNSVVKDVTASLNIELYPTFYAGLASNIAGTVLCHVLLLKSIPRPPLSDKDAQDKQTLLKRFRLSDRRYNLLWTLEPAPLLFALGVCVVCLIHLVALRAEIISFEATGFTASLTPSEGPAHFNLWTIALNMPSSLYAPGDISKMGVHLLALIYFVVVIALPIAVVAVSLALLLVPCGKRFQFNLLFYSPFWFSWCSIDVFLLITLSEYLEMGHITEYMSDIQYPEMCGFVKNKLHSICSGVDVKVGHGMYSLIALCICLLFVRARFIALYEMMGQKETSDRLPHMIV